MGVGDSKTVPFEPIHKTGHYARRDKFTRDLAVLHAPLLEFEDDLGRYGAPFHSGHFGKLHHFAAAIAQTRELNDDVQSGSYLLPESPLRQVYPGHQHHGL